VPVALSMFCIDYNAAAIKISPMIAHWTQPLGFASLPDIFGYHLTLDLHALDCMTIDGELPILLMIASTPLHTHGAGIILPAL